MPVIAQARKKMRQDKHRKARNTVVRETMRKTVKTARTKPSTKTLTEAYRVLDKAAKLHVIHANKASRLKSRLAKKQSDKITK